MNYKIFTAALLLMGTAAAAQDPEDLRIYINPGHGSWTSNDRPMQVIGKEPYTSSGTDTTNFFESNTDLIKGFGVLEKLIEMGFPFDRTLNQTDDPETTGAARDMANNLVMSRVKNGPYNPVINDRDPNHNPNWQVFNRDLYEICCEVEENEFDAFISIHSNAASVNNVNYHLLMYRGKNGKGNVAVNGSWELIESTAKYSFAIDHMLWTEKDPYIYGETDFMGHGSGSYNGLGYYGYLGVLKHGTPGYLVEGYFHTYTPGMHRAMNWDVDMIEGYAYARGVADYFELGEVESTGEIYGIVRDAHSTFKHKLYIGYPGSVDELKPLNGATAILYKDGQKIKEYKTDEFYNGAFVFYGLEPGKYEIVCSHPDYTESQPMEVEVQAGNTAYPKVFLTDRYYNGRPGEELNYISPIPDGLAIEDNYAMTAAFSDKEIAQLAGKTPERLIWNKGRVYVLARDAQKDATVIVLDCNTGDVLTEVDLTGCEGTAGAVGDIQLTGDGVLLASNLSKNQLEDKYIEAGDVRGTSRIYYWDRDENGLPTGTAHELFSSQTSGGHRRGIIGNTFAMRGNLDDGEIVVSAVATTKSAPLYTEVRTIENGTALNYTEHRPATVYATDFDGDYRFVLSPTNRHQFFLIGNSSKKGIREYEFDHALSVACNTENTNLSKNSQGAGFFRFSDRALMTFATPGAGSLTCKLYDVSRGMTAPEEIQMSGIAFTGEAQTVLTTGFPVADNLGGGNFHVMVLRDNKLSRYYSPGPAQAGVANVSADNTYAPAVYYDLNGRRVEDPHLVPGIYVRLQGTEATKVVVK